MPRSRKRNAGKNRYKANPPYPQHPQSAEPEAKATDRQKESPPSDPKENVSFNLPNDHWWQRPEWWLAGLTALLCLITYLQWQSTKDIIRSSDEQFRKGNRAYITLMQAQVKVLEPNGGSTSKIVVPTNFPIIRTPRSIVEVTLKNTGGSPAVDVQTRIVACNCERIPSDTIAEVNKLGTGSDPATTGVPVAKEGPLYINTVTPVISDSELAEVLAEKRFIVAYGFAAYKDVFAEPHRTDFCVVYNPKSNSLGNCERGNKLD
jgi:hypothetical protein